MVATRRTRPHRRLTFAAQSSNLATGCWLLEVRRGAWCKTTDREGNDLSTVRDPLKRLLANIGDGLVVSAADLASDAIANVEVVSMDGRGQPTVRVRAGAMPSGAALVMPAERARPQRKRG